MIVGSGSKTTKMSMDTSPEIRYTSLRSNQFLRKLKKWGTTVKDGAIRGMRAVLLMQHMNCSLSMQIPMRNTIW